jgi:hypothetical protein
MVFYVFLSCVMCSSLYHIAINWITAKIIWPFLRLGSWNVYCRAHEMSLMYGSWNVFNVGLIKRLYCKAHEMYVSSGSGCIRHEFSIKALIKSSLFKCFWITLPVLVGNTGLPRRKVIYSLIFVRYLENIQPSSEPKHPAQWSRLSKRLAIFAKPCLLWTPFHVVLYSLK